jgi:cob(I)alamin adenosyltransferase
MKGGLLTVFTGEGKGKTTAALGMAVRAIGHGMKVCMVQFVKGPWKTGEWDALGRFDEMVVHVVGKGFIYGDDDIDRNREAAVQAWQLAKGFLRSREFSMVILDELTYLIKYGMVNESEVCAALGGRREDLHVIVTGRDAPECIMGMADLVTEMREVKHPLHSGIKAQKGIEY